jgi:hypothetical protein
MSKKDSAFTGETKHTDDEISFTDSPFITRQLGESFPRLSYQKK